MKPHRFGLEFSGQHRSALERLAEDDGETMSAVLRSLIRQEARKRGLWPTKEARGDASGRRPT